MNNKISREIFQIFISILFAAATSYLLSIIAALHQIEGFLWFFLSILPIIAIIWSVSYFFNISIFPENMDEAVRIAKTGLIILITLILFAISRFINFFYNNTISTLDVEDAFRWIWIIIFLCGIFLGFLTGIEFWTNRKEKNYKSIAIIAVILLIVSSILIYFSSLILKLRELII